MAVDVITTELRGAEKCLPSPPARSHLRDSLSTRRDAASTISFRCRYCCVSRFVLGACGMTTAAHICLAVASLGTCCLTVVGLGPGRVGGSSNVFAADGGSGSVLSYEILLWVSCRMTKVSVGACCVVKLQGENICAS